MSPDDIKTQRILQAVRFLLARNGYMGTTITLVAKEAGVSRGLLHYYFKNKDEMLAQVVKENMEASISMIQVIFTRHRSARGYAKGITTLLKDVMQNDPDFFHLFFEGLAVARQSPIVHAELKSLYGRFRKALETCLNNAKQDNAISPQLPIPALAAIITGLIDGMGLQFLTEPDLNRDDKVWQSMESAILDLLTTPK